MTYDQKVVFTFPSEILIRGRLQRPGWMLPGLGLSDSEDLWWRDVAEAING